MVKKKFLKTKCQVEFDLPEGLAQDVERVCLVGEFNQWDTQATPLKRGRDKRFKVSLDLPLNQEYQYRYLINDTNWQNDWDADSYVPNPFSDTNSVVNTFEAEKVTA